MDNKFLISSQECELLLAFERTGNLQDLAEYLAKDISVVSRNLKSLAEKSNLLEKQNRKWILTAQGKSLNSWTREAIYSQKLATQRQKSLKIACTREFAKKVLLPQTRILVGDDSISVSIISTDEGIEKIIGKGEADFGFDCGRPIDPSIAFKRLVNEPFVVVASPKFVKREKVKTYDELKQKDLLKFSRTENLILDLDVRATHYYGTISDLSSLIEACLLGYGWAILPKYTVKKELTEKKLIAVPGLTLPSERYGVWWLRERHSVKPWVNKAIQWLKKQDLS